MSAEAPETVKALVDLCRTLEITCVVQVGAEDGHEAACIMLETGAHALCIEPDPKCVPETSWPEFHEVLIGATNSVVDFYLNETPGLSSQLPRYDGVEIKLTMPQIRLDTFCWKHAIKPDALIIDTEGTTLDVLEGAGDLLDNVRLIYAEVQTQELRPGMRLLPEVDAFLTAKGFTRHEGPPSYSAGEQENATWVHPRSKLASWGSHQPALRAIAKFLDIRSVVEFGAGFYSTHLFLDREVFPNLETLTTFEHDGAWAAKVRTNDPRHTLIVIPADQFAARSTGMQADFVFLDSGPTFAARFSLVHHCLTIAPVFAIHDHRFEQLSGLGFKYLKGFNSAVQTVFASNDTDLSKLELL